MSTNTNEWDNAKNSRSSRPRTIAVYFPDTEEADFLYEELNAVASSDDRSLSKVIFRIIAKSLSSGKSDFTKDV